jgi:hypothetical protein
MFESDVHRSIYQTYVEQVVPGVYVRKILCYSRVLLWMTSKMMSLGDSWYEAWHGNLVSMLLRWLHCMLRRYRCTWTLA